MTLLNNILPEKRRGKLKTLLEIGKTVRVLEAHNGLSGIIANNIQALFEVKKVRDNSVTVIDLFKNQKYLINENDSKLIFRKNDIFQGRIVFHHAQWHFTGHFCFHPNKNQGFIFSFFP